MKKLLYTLVCLLLVACGSDDNGTIVHEPPANDTIVPESPVNYSLLWGKWNFSYETNTMSGNRSYTFQADGNFLYLDEWRTRDADWNLGPVTSHTKKGTYFLSDYKLLNNDSAKGKIVIGEQKIDFSISSDGFNLILILNEDECYIKE